MKSILLILLILTIISCKQNTVETEKTLTSNKELSDLYAADQADRQTDNIDWSVVFQRDKNRQKRVLELLDSNFTKTAEDYGNAAMIFQHGMDTTASGMAVKLMRKAVELDPNRSKWLLAAAIDRDLTKRGKPQIYGTQFLKKGMDQPWIRYEMDSTKVTDEERIEYEVETLAEQQEKLRMMNKKKLSELLTAGKSVEDIIKIVESSDIKKSAYNLSPRGINSFGYHVMSEGKNEKALKIFKLYTQLYPENANAYDSYGECLLKLGKTKDGIIAYKKSVELNPKNDHAKKVIKEMELKK